MAVQITGFNSLLSEVNDGHPVVIFENLGLSWYQQWHYAVVIGYDLNREDIIMHSGHDEASRTDLKIFERSWKLSDYWALAVLPPGQIAKSAGELANMRAAAGLEMVGRNDEAQRSYESILQVWPKSVSALIGLGNLAFARGDYRASVNYLRRAHEIDPDSKAAEHNLKVAEEKLRSKI
jgi:tetratricopeptide (TPR) repeat protein